MVRMANKDYRMRNSLKILICFYCLIALGGCAPLIPSNYLSTSSVTAWQKVGPEYIRPRLIPVSVQTLNSAEGRRLIEPAMRNKSYQIGTYDSLNIIVWGHPELSTVSTVPIMSATSNALGNNAATNPVILVQTNGEIFFPYVGNIKVAGLTTTEIQEKITVRLAEYIRHPQVSVQVAQFRNRNIYVLGEVKSPGQQPITDKPLSLMEAISTSGGIDTNYADPSHIYVIRGSYLRPDVFWLNAQTPQSLMIAERFILEENDIVYVSAASLTGVNRFLNQILPSITTYVIAQGLASK